MKKSCVGTVFSVMLMLGLFIAGGGIFAVATGAETSENIGGADAGTCASCTVNSPNSQQPPVVLFDPVKSPSGGAFTDPGGSKGTSIDGPVWGNTPPMFHDPYSRPPEDVLEDARREVPLIRKLGTGQGEGVFLPPPDTTPNLKGFLNWLKMLGLFGYWQELMGRPGQDSQTVPGPFSLLWHLFQEYCRGMKAAKAGK